MTRPPGWAAAMAAERAANRTRSEHADRMTAEHHAAAERSGLPQPRRHRGVTLPDNAPEKWEVEGE